TTFSVLNVVLTAAGLSLRHGQPFRSIAIGETRAYAANLFALAPLAWLMAQIFQQVAWWAALLFALPLYTTRMAYHRFVEMREMFTQTIGALAEAVDKRDPFTSKNRQNVK